MQATQGLVGKVDTIGLGPNSVCEKGNLCGRMGMGTSNNRGRQWEYSLGVLGGHAR